MSFRKINNKAEELADSITYSLAIEDISTDYLVGWLRDAWGYSIELRYVKLQQGFSGMVYPDYRDNNKFIVHINNTESVDRQRYTLCHEVAHILRSTQLKFEYSTDREVYNNKELERFCDRFAAAFLMPKEKFFKLWASVLVDNEILKIASLARRLKVSPEACRNRAIDFNLIN